MREPWIDTRVDNGNAKPKGWISPEEQGRRDYAAWRASRDLCACGHPASQHPDDDEPACIAPDCWCAWWYEGRPDWDES